jgi:hypothetical protein
VTGRGRDHPQKDEQYGQANELNPARNLDARGAPVRAHGNDATARVALLRPPDWEWSFQLDGALALKPQEASATVPRMSPPAPTRRARRTRSRHLDRERRLRRLAVLVALLVVGLVTLLLSAFGGSGAPAQVSAPASAARLLPAGPPLPEIVARLGTLHLQLPVSQSRVTAVGYQGGSAGALALSPLGTQANEGLLKRVVHSILGGSSGRPRWYQLPGGLGPGSSSIDVGAPAGTDVYSPVDGTIVAIADVILNGTAVGSRIDIQPNGAPSLVVSISHVRVDTGLAVGSAVTSGSSRLGEVLDFSHVERQALARYTNDSGNHVPVEVHPAATLQVP